jgi:type II secretory pathway pseudopilin PulG
MMTTHSRPIRRNPSEDGYMMVAVIFLMALLVISLAVAAPQIKASIQRDREVETMERGKQYIRAVQLYYRKFHAYPPNIDALVKTQEIRFLRKKYIDPTTGKDEWKPIQFGQNKAPTAMGFFGQPLGGSSIAGTGPSGGNGLQGATPMGSSQFGASQQGGLFQNTTQADPNAQQGQTGQDPNAANGTGASGSAAGGPGTGQTGQTFGGAGIIGFSPGSPKQSILVYKKKTHYNEWEFVYDPLNDQQGMGAAGAGLNGTPGTGTSTIPGQPGNRITPPGGGFLQPQPPTQTPTPTPPPPPPQQPPQQQ